MPDLSIPLGSQLVWLVILAIPVACIAWTITHEEVFREPREYCQRQTRVARTLPRRKFFYLFTCEYCFSHYIAAVFLVITRFHMLYVGWRGYLVALFALIWVATARLRQDSNMWPIDFVFLAVQTGVPMAVGRTIGLVYWRIRIGQRLNARQAVAAVACLVIVGWTYLIFH